MPRPATHNDLIFGFLAALGRGEFPGYEWAEFFSGKFDQPLQMTKLGAARVFWVRWR